MNTKYRSMQTFRAALAKVMGENSQATLLLKASWIETPLGPMIALADEKALHLLEFWDRKGFEAELKQLKKRSDVALTPGISTPLASIQKELELYFKGQLTEFKTPVTLQGTPFQETVWRELTQISYGQTRSYAALAENIGRPSAFRAVARANSTNRLAIIVPCHRVINSDGKLGGYAGGLDRKEKLLKLEQVKNKESLKCQ